MDTEQKLSRFRALKRRCEELCENVVNDLNQFRAADTLTFRSLPDHDPNNVGVASTCTCLMATVAASKISAIYTRDGDLRSDLRMLAEHRAEDAFSRIFPTPWDSSGLPDGNPFTATVVARTAAILATKGIGSLESHRARVHEFRDNCGTIYKRETLEEIVHNLIIDVPSSIRVQKFPAHPTLAYWLLEAVSCLKIDTLFETWKKLAEWAARKFVFELSRVTSGHDALMDPVALAMAACLCRKIQCIASEAGFPDAAKLLREVPTLQELESGVKGFLSLQRPSGIWAKFFPLFHYAQAANYPFTFEVLEAIIDQFNDEKTTLFDDEQVVAAFERALTWCEKNRLQFPYEGHVYSGWNSGGDRDALRDGKPEAWATGTVYIFAAKFRELLRARIQAVLLLKYDALAPLNGKPWIKLIDVDVTLPTSDIIGVKQVLEREIMVPFREHDKLERRAALLFGPPGTSKTGLVRAFSSSLGWYCVEITPSRFLRGGLEQIYVNAEDVFRDVNDLRNVVIFFDEMDALVQRREESKEHRLDVAQQFLTTSMLPHLARLHANEDVVFFMATNHQGAFDQAIKRPGRFDLLLCVGPPSWFAKKQNIGLFYERSDTDAIATREILNRWVPDGHALAIKLDLFTFDELKLLLEAVTKQYVGMPLSMALESMGFDKFKSLVAHWHDHYITLRPRGADGEANPLVKEFEEDKKESRLQ